MLHGEDFRGGHERHLAAALDRHDRRLDSDYGLSGPYVPLEKAVHGMGRAHVVHDFLQRSLLGCGRMKRQDFLNRLADIFRNPELDPRHGLCFPALQGEAGANVEKLLENQAYLRGRPKLAKIFETLFLIREMRLTEGARPVRQLIPHAHRLGQALWNLSAQRGERSPDQPAQDARPERPDRLVDRHHAAYLQRSLG